VNYLNLKANTTSPNYQFIGEMHVYWDRASGIIVETIQTIEYINITEGYVTKMLGYMVITETNIWTSEKTYCALGTSGLDLDLIVAFSEKLKVTEWATIRYNLSFCDVEKSIRGRGI